MVVTQKNVLKSKTKKKTTGTKKVKKTTASKVKDVVQKSTPTPVATPEPVATPDPVQENSEPVTQENAPVSDSKSEQESAFELLGNMVIELQQQLKTLNKHVVTLHKNYKREVKELKKESSKKKKRGGDPNKKRAPSGFAKPTNLSTQLCEFLEVPSDTQLARTEVTKLITKYIKDHKLQKEENKKIILPDPKLKSLLNSEDKEVTYFNLQTFMKVHFIKEESSVNSTA